MNVKYFTSRTLNRSKSKLHSYGTHSVLLLFNSINLKDPCGSFQRQPVVAVITDDEHSVLNFPEYFGVMRGSFLFSSYFKKKHSKLTSKASRMQYYWLIINESKSEIREWVLNDLDLKLFAMLVMMSSDRLSHTITTPIYIRNAFLQETMR